MGIRILVPLENDMVLFFSDQPEVLSGDILDDRGVGTKVLHLLPEIRDLLPEPGVLLLELFLRPVDLVAVQNPDFPEEGVENADPADAGRKKHRQPLPDPCLSFARFHRVTGTTGFSRDPTRRVG